MYHIIILYQINEVVHIPKTHISVSLDEEAYQRVLTLGRNNVSKTINRLIVEHIPNHKNWLIAQANELQTKLYDYDIILQIKEKGENDE